MYSNLDFYATSLYILKAFDKDEIEMMRDMFKHVVSVRSWGRIGGEIRMENDKSKIKKVVIFSENLYGVGGAERLLFEEAKYFEKLGIETYIFSLNFKSDVLFNNTYDINVEQIGQNSDGSRNLLFKIGQRIFNINALRQRLKEIKPDIIISTSQWDCITLYLATIFTTSAYVTHIHGTIFWFHDDPSKIRTHLQKCIQRNKGFCHWS